MHQPRPIEAQNLSQYLGEQSRVFFGLGFLDVCLLNLAEGVENIVDERLDVLQGLLGAAIRRKDVPRLTRLQDTAGGDGVGSLADVADF